VKKTLGAIPCIPTTDPGSPMKVPSEAYLPSGAVPKDLPNITLKIVGHGSSSDQAAEELVVDGEGHEVDHLPVSARLTITLSADSDEEDSVEVLGEDGDPPHVTVEFLTQLGCRTTPSLEYLMTSMQAGAAQGRTDDPNIKLLEELLKSTRELVKKDLEGLGKTPGALIGRIFDVTAAHHVRVDSVAPTALVLPDVLLDALGTDCVPVAVVDIDPAVLRANEAMRQLLLSIGVMKVVPVPALMEICATSNDRELQKRALRHLFANFNARVRLSPSWISANLFIR
jgi:hypothetical protein